MGMARYGLPASRREIWEWRLRHPSCWVRVARSSTRSAWLWRLQGRPRDIPVVIRPGRLIADPEGRGMIRDWHFDFRYMERAIDVGDLWDRLSALYPVERKP